MCSMFLDVCKNRINYDHNRKLWISIGGYRYKKKIGRIQTELLLVNGITSINSEEECKKNSNLLVVCSLEAQRFVKNTFILGAPT